MNAEVIEIATKAVQLYAETHPRPPSVTKTQAAKMIGKSVPTITKLVKCGVIKLNKFGEIPITEIDRALAKSA